MAIEETEQRKRQFRYHFGSLWNLIKDNSIRQIGLCSDAPDHLDYTKRWDEYSVVEQDIFIGHAMWKFDWSDILKDKRMES